jgi:hypothetical protein
MKFIFAFCEGPHDVAFLYKILKSEGYVSHNKKLGEYPAPINNFLVNEATHSSLEEVNLQSATQRLLPAEVMRKADPERLIFLYALGGDSRSAERLRILRFLQDSFAISDPDALFPGEEHNAAAIYFFDADEAGIQARFDIINRELTELWDEPTPLLSPEDLIAEVNGLQVGGFIFSANEQNTGKLEDALLPLMRLENEAIFDAAQAFLDEHYNADRCKKLRWRPDTETQVMQETRSSRRLKYDRNKSIIGIVGQLQQSGKGNGPIIRDTDFINLQKLQNHVVCQAIVRFIRRL